MASPQYGRQTDNPKKWWNRNPERGPIKHFFPQCLLPRLSILLKNPLISFYPNDPSTILFPCPPLKLLNLLLNREYHPSGLWRIPNHFSFLPPTSKLGLREILTPLWRIPNHSGPRLLSNFTRDHNMISAFFLLSTHNQFGDMQASGLFFFFFFSEAKDKFELCISRNSSQNFNFWRGALAFQIRAAGSYRGIKVSSQKYLKSLGSRKIARCVQSSWNLLDVWNLALLHYLFHCWILYTVTVILDSQLSLYFAEHYGWTTSWSPTSFWHDCTRYC